MNNKGGERMETIKDSLEMVFQAEEGKNVKVTLYDQKEELTAETVSEAMHDVVTMEALVNDTGHLMIGAYSAKTIRKIENQLF